MPSTIDLAVAGRLPARDAVSYFQSKGRTVSWNWFETHADVHARMFTVAKAVRMDVLTTLQGSVDQAIAEGTTQEAFIAALTPKLQKLGWWGQQVVVDSAGNAQKVQLGSPRRLALIYNVNTRVAYNAGRYAQMMSDADAFPFWQYVAIMDGRTRPEHARLHGLVFRYDDPFWRWFYPPNGWQCRCRVRALSAARMKALGLTTSYGASFIQTREVEAGVDPTTGEVFKTTSATFDNGRVKMTPDVGWSHNPGMAAFGTDTALIRKMADVKDAALRQQVVQCLNGSRERKLALSLWLKRAAAGRAAGEALRPLGLVSEPLADRIAALSGQPAPRLLVLTDETVRQANLTSAECAQVACLADTPVAVLWSGARQQLAYVTELQDGGILLACSQNGDAANLYRTVQLVRMTAEALCQVVRDGEWQILSGHLPGGETQ
ncbi:phage head morphogenesis protein [Salmonella enterica]|nr:phage head morphogenesis protein [Salmonella enterica]